MRSAALGAALAALLVTACSPGLGQDDLAPTPTSSPAADASEAPAVERGPACGPSNGLGAAEDLGRLLLDPQLCSLLDFPHADVGTPVSDLTAPGLQDVDVTALTLDDGVVAAAEGPEGGAALRFPSWSDGDAVPRAVLSLRPAGAASDSLDVLEPGEADFAFAASFSQEAPAPQAQADDGDNLIQRGLFSEPSQFKISVDGGRPSCRVAGSRGEVLVNAKENVKPDTWYRVGCARHGDEVILVVGQVVGADVVPVEEARGTGPTGDVSWPGDTPVALGGKLTKEGRIMRSATDQFHGLVADPVVVILAGPTG